MRGNPDLNHPCNDGLSATRTNPHDYGDRLVQAV